MSLLDTLINVAGSLIKDNPDMQEKLTGAMGDFFKEVGGLPGLIAKFQANGLGEVITSWMGSGEKKTISGEQLHQTLGSDLMTALADKAGVDPSIFDSLFAKGLPSLVRHLTEGGKAPEQVGNIDLDTTKEWVNKIFS